MSKVFHVIHHKIFVIVNISVCAFCFWGAKCPVSLLIKDAGNLVTDVAIRLHRAVFPVVMTEIAHLTAIRRIVVFFQCIYNKMTQVKRITAYRAGGVQDIRIILAHDAIPMLIDPTAKILSYKAFDAVIYAILAKRNTGTKKHLYFLGGMVYGSTDHLRWRSCLVRGCSYGRTIGI